ncbi:MAG: hypothetical protein PHD04_02280 [Candidatus Pacebacteria bacterium]|nr:hypothetical protein [Candidatus Paceibacterota bacterium]
MDPEMKKLLEETHALVKDNHVMLRTIRREHWYGIIIRVVFWAILIGVPAYYYAQYLQPFVAKYQATTGLNTTGPFGLPTSADLQKLINSFKVGQ